MTSGAHSAADLDDRYGRVHARRTKRIWGVSVGVLAVAAVGYFGYTTVVSNMNAVSVDGLGFTIVDSHSVDVSFQYTAPRGRDVVCAVEALDQEHGTVGFSLVSYEASESHTQKMTTTVRTVAEATTGLVKGCWVA